MAIVFPTILHAKSFRVPLVSDGIRPVVEFPLNEDGTFSFSKDASIVYEDDSDFEPPIEGQFPLDRNRPIKGKY